MPSQPWRACWTSVESVLHGALPGAQAFEENGSARASWSAPLCSVIVLGALYGAAMGAYGLSMGAGLGRGVWPMLFGALKVPILLLLTGALSLPSFFVLYTLMGLRDDFTLVLRALLATQVGLSAILASLAPLTLLCYVSLPALSSSYPIAVLWNFAMFGVASVSSQAILRFHLRPLWQRDARHRSMLRAWILIYGFIGVQLAYVLRPFIGDPAHGTAFLRPDAFSNAYLALWELLRRALQG